nr:TPA_asm: hypothetical protein HUJ06_009540 [Nelumbo nucifera]
MASCSCSTLPSLSCLQATLTTVAIFLVSLVSDFSLSTSSTLTTGNGFRKIYAFGDSYTDTGNTHSSTGPTNFEYVSSPPYGTTFFHQPTNRYSDGRLVIDFVAEAFSLPYLPPYLNQNVDTSHGVNFAVAGSTAIDHDFFVINNLTLDSTPQSLHTQLTWFNKFLEDNGCGGTTTLSSSAECRRALDDALFWVGEIGVNDYAYLVGSTVSPTTIQDLAINSITGFLQELLKRGAKYVVVQGLPMTGCLSMAMEFSLLTDRDDVGCVGSINMLSSMHNSALQDKLQGLRRQYPDAIIAYADYFSAYHAIIKNHHKYGFQEPFKTCCGSGGDPYNFVPFATCGSPAASTACSNPAQFINWDGVHLTEAMYKATADLFLHRSYSHPPFSVLMSRRTHGN